MDQVHYRVSESFARFEFTCDPRRLELLEDQLRILKMVLYILTEN